MAKPLKERIKDLPCGKKIKLPVPNPYNKKIVRKECYKDGAGKKHKVTLMYGDSRYTSNTTAKQRSFYRHRHKCSSAKPHTREYYACKDLWSSKAPKYTKALKMKYRKGKK